MTLYRQLVIFTLALFLILFTGTWLVTFNSTRSFLINQLESHAQDTATSLGLALSQRAIEKDRAGIASMIDAVFDRGYYQAIRFVDIEGKVIMDRNLAVAVENVPAWFIDLAPLDAPEANANVMAGWRQAGRIYVKSHPGYAYSALWEDGARMTLWFAACGIFVFLIGGLGLRFLLKPLVLVQRQADAICRKEYESQEPLPRTKELRQVVIAMNRMTGKVKEMFEEQAVFAEGFREHAYRDPLTGLGNRRYFEAQMRARHEEGEGAGGGILLLVSIHDLQQLNRQKGLQAGDELLKAASLILQGAAQPYPNHILARLMGGDFALFLPESLPWDAPQIAEETANAISRLAERKLSVAENVAHIGAVTCDAPTALGSLLSESDLALRTAQQKGPNAWHVRGMSKETERLPAGEQQWKRTLEDVLKAGRIRLDVQPVVRTADRGECIHIEIFSKIVRGEDGEEFRAELFLPFAERLGLVSLLDRVVLEEAMRLDKRKIGVDTVAVNISPASLSDAAFRDWLYAALKALSPSAPRLAFEFAEFGAIRNLASVKEFRENIQLCGHLMALDHYGQSLSKLSYLRFLRPDYVKVDRAYTEELKDAASDSRFYMGSLCSVAHSIDVMVIAEGVETEEQLQLLRALNIDGMQGYAIDRPKPMAENQAAR
ncbi:MAG: RNase E specificity factor CsrD [Syntrophus sp. PtaU1.Bin208]|nr:MAG: RNase E specificity factor CsrD [Syntrophus sp. PtaU1.Bin208]